jgi:hypothetical protein
VAERYFTPEEVRSLIPALTEIMERAMAAQREAAEAEERMRDEQRRIAMGGGGVVDREVWRGLRGRRERAGAAVQEALREILAMGGVPKDLELGLVDFPHRRGGEVVNLCWKYGEREVRFWHGLDEGYAGRKPL